MDTTKKLIDLEQIKESTNVSQSNINDNELLIIDDIDLTEEVTDTNIEVQTIEEQIKNGLHYLAKKFSDGSVIYCRVTLNEELLKLKNLDYSGEYLFDYDTGIELSWDILKRVEIVTEGFINNLPILDKFLNGGVKKCF